MIRECKIQVLFIICPANISSSLFGLRATKLWVTRWRSWFRHCATSRKVAGSSSDFVIGIFHWHNPSGRTMALESTQPPTEMSTRNISWVITADNLTTFMCRLSWNLRASTSWNPQGLSRPVKGLLYLAKKLITAVVKINLSLVPKYTVFSLHSLL